MIAEDEIQERPLRPAEVIKLEMHRLIKQRFKILLSEVVVIHQHHIDLMLET